MFKKKIAKFFTKTFVGRLTDNIVLGGAINNVTENTEKSPNGKLDAKELILQIVSSVIPIVLLISFIKGWLTIEEVKHLVNLLLP
jgi:hypothetical protein